MPRLLVTADLHYGMLRTTDAVVEALQAWALEESPVDAVVVAGDAAECIGLSVEEMGKNHTALFEQIQLAFPETPIAFCAGNHDVWLNDPEADSWWLFRDRLAEVAHAMGVHYLDTDGPLFLTGVTVVGSMIHYDYSLRDPELTVDGAPIPEEAFLTKVPPGFGVPVWNDAKYIRWEMTDEQVCQELCERLDADLRHALTANDAPVVVATHHLPSNAVNAWMLNPERRPLTGFFSAFSGTTRLGDLLRQLAQEHPGRIVRALSGHTHRVVEPVDIGGVLCENIGGDYGQPRRVLIDV